jgi:hypothetical protein
MTESATSSQSLGQLKVGFRGIAEKIEELVKICDKLTENFKEESIGLAFGVLYI